MRNSTKRLYRFIEHINRLNEFSYREAVLNPERVVNRAIWGTDYDPKECGLRFLISEKLEENKRGYKC